MKPNEQAKQGRCGAVNQDGEPCVCSRWRGHPGVHRGPSQGHFYSGARFEWPQAVPAGATPIAEGATESAPNSSSSSSPLQTPWTSHP